MGVPKRKVSKSRRDQRSAGKFIRPNSVASCSQCGHAKLGHQVCEQCGFYKGVKVIVTAYERSVKRDQVRKVAQARRAERDQNARGEQSAQSAE